MSQYECYYIEFGPLRQFVTNLCRLLAALLPVTQVKIRRIKKYPLAPILVTVLIRHDFNLRDLETLYAVIEALRPGALTVRFHITPIGRSSEFPHVAIIRIFIYDQPIPADFVHEDI